MEYFSVQKRQTEQFSHNLHERIQTRHNQDNTVNTNQAIPNIQHAYQPKEFTKRRLTNERIEFTNILSLITHFIRMNFLVIATCCIGLMTSYIIADFFKILSIEYNMIMTFVSSIIQASSVIVVYNLLTKYCILSDDTRNETPFSKGLLLTSVIVILSLITALIPLLLITALVDNQTQLTLPILILSASCSVITSSIFMAKFSFMIPAALQIQQFSANQILKNISSIPVFHFFVFFLIVKSSALFLMFVNQYFMTASIIYTLANAIIFGVYHIFVCLYIATAYRLQNRNSYNNR